MEKIKEKLKLAKLLDKAVEHELKALWKYGVEKISDMAIRTSVVDFLETEAPLAFFIKPASSSSKYHPIWQNKKAGILRNTTECCLAVDRQLRIYKEFCDEKDGALPWPRNIVLAATILSDTFKYDKEILNGEEILSEGKTNRNHGKIAANIWLGYATKHGVEKSIKREIFQATYWHLGRWTEGWTSETKFSLLTKIVHRIDMIFSEKSLEITFIPKRVIE